MCRYVCADDEAVGHKRVPHHRSFLPATAAQSFITKNNDGNKCIVDVVVVVVHVLQQFNSRKKVMKCLLLFAFFAVNIYLLDKWFCPTYFATAAVRRTKCTTWCLCRSLWRSRNVRFTVSTSAVPKMHFSSALLSPSTKSCYPPVHKWELFRLSLCYIGSFIVLEVVRYVFNKNPRNHSMSLILYSPLVHLSIPPRRWYPIYQSVVVLRLVGWKCISAPTTTADITVQQQVKNINCNN